MSVLEFINNSALPQHTDWRLPENRMEAFRRVVMTRMYEGDLDHWHTGKVIASEMNLSDDDKALYSLLFGQSYRNHFAMIVMQEFPKLLDTPKHTLIEWHNDNWKRAFFAKDTKWGLRKFPDFVESIKHAIKDETPYEWIKNSLRGTTEENFYALNAQLRSLYGIGRMTAWLAQQTIYEFFDFDIDHWDLQLYDDTWSQYDALCYIFNREDISTKDSLGNKRRPSKEEISLMEKHFQELMTYINDNSPIHLDVYNIESALCEHRKHMGTTRKPKEFPFWTTVELAMEYEKLHDAWSEINWTPYVIGLGTKGPNVRLFNYSPEYFRVGVDYGLNFNTHHYFEDEPNAYEVLSLPHKTQESAQRVLTEFNKLPNADELIRKYNPLNMLRYK